MSLPDLILAVTLAFIAACWLTDVRTRSIPNILSGAAFVAGVIMNLLLSGRWGLVSSLAGAVIGVGVLLGPFALGGIGGGDVKMMGAVGALLGPLSVLHALAVGLMLGGIVMILHLVGLGRLREKLASTASMLTGAWSAKSLVPLRLSDEDAAAVTLPYSVPLGLGTVAVLLPRVGSLGPLF
jgi:prepilin peptidase CpaA